MCNQRKIEIKKVKQQPTEKKVYNIGNYVVYPKHGVGKITAVEKAKIGEIDITFYVLWVCSKFGLVWDMRPVPQHIKEDHL